MSDDAEAMARLREGDATVFNALFTENFVPLARNVARIVRSKDIAEDLVQDVFARLWSGRAELQVRGDIKHYLLRAARNRALDWLAHESVHQRWTESVAHESRQSGDDAKVFGDNATEDAQLVLSTALAKMPEKRRRICQLRWLDSVGPAEIARRLGLSVKTVETQLSRGLKVLRENIAE